MSTVRMTRDKATNPPPYDADVHPAEVANWARYGWQQVAEPEPAPTRATAKAQPAPLADPEVFAEDDKAVHAWAKEMGMSAHHRLAGEKLREHLRELTRQ